MSAIIDFFCNDLPADLQYVRPIVAVLVATFSIGVSFELIPTLLIALLSGRSHK